MVRLVDVVAVQFPDLPEGGHAGRKHAFHHPKRVGRRTGAVKEEAVGQDGPTLGLRRDSTFFHCAAFFSRFRLLTGHG